MIYKRLKKADLRTIVS